MSFNELRNRPSNEEIYQLVESLSFDISCSNKELQFYLRDKNIFYNWMCTVPEDGRSSTDWEEHDVYTYNQVDTTYAPLKYSSSYTGHKTKEYAISDTLFFDGHFKVITQNNEKFIINRKHGYIYYIGKQKVERIGKVQINNDYAKIQGKPLFIEDRDQNRLIFFSPVEWEVTNLPKPNVYYMKEDEMREYFKYVMD